jgi:maleate isomerase
MVFYDVLVLDLKHAKDCENTMNYSEFEQFEVPLNCHLAERDPRAHIGLVLLNTDHTLEADWSKLLGVRALSFTSRVQFSGEITVEGLKQIEQNLSSAAQLVATGLTMDVMAFACTSASIMIGCDNIDQLLNTNRTPVPTTNPWRAVKAALRQVNANRVAVLAPYSTEVNHRLYLSFLEAGFEIPALGGLGLNNDFDISHASKATLFDGLDRLVEHTQADALFLSCTNLRVVDHIEEMEARYGLPVISSNQALLWHALQLADKSIDIENGGRLFGQPFLQVAV